MSVNFLERQVEMPKTGYGIMGSGLFSFSLSVSPKRITFVLRPSWPSWPSWPNYYPLLFRNNHAVCLRAKFHVVPDSALDTDILPV